MDESAASKSGVSARTRRLLLGTTALSVPLILMGIYTAIAGYGLTCEGRWPLCDGAVFGLFPANWGSFVEWFHRLIAMIFGFAVLGTAISAWRDDLARRPLYAILGAIALTPLQIVFGGLTVTAYERVILAAHFVTAICIFLLLATATIATLDRRRLSVRTAATASAVFSLVALPVVPGSTIAAGIGLSSQGIFVAFYFLTLLAASGFLTVAIEAPRRPRVIAGLGGTVLVGSMVLSRIVLSPTATALVFVGVAVALLAAVAVVVLDVRSPTTPPSRVGDEPA